MQVTGILTGDDWTPSDPAPPNGLFELTFVLAAHWNLVVGTLEFFIDWSTGWSLCNIGFFEGPRVFRDYQLETRCLKQFTSQYNTPAGRKYYGGRVILTNPLDSGVNNNIALMRLLNIEPAIRTFVSPQPIATDIFTHRYSSRKGHTNILIKYDFT